MKNKKLLDESKLLSKVFGLLMDKIGPTETHRFINLIKTTKSDSVQRHRMWQQKLDKKDFFQQVFGAA